MLFMVIEHIKDSKAVYHRLREKGRTMPQGLRYVGSWVGADLSRCFQLMDCADARAKSLLANCFMSVMDWRYLARANLKCNLSNVKQEVPHRIRLGYL